MKDDPTEKEWKRKERVKRVTEKLAEMAKGETKHNTISTFETAPTDEHTAKDQGDLWIWIQGDIYRAHRMQQTAPEMCAKVTRMASAYRKLYGSQSLGC